MVPWTEIDQATAGAVTFPLIATADYGDAVCVRTWDLNLDVLEHPQFNLTVPSSICVGSIESIAMQPVQGAVNGQNPTGFSWSNLDDPPVFDITTPPTGGGGTIEVNALNPMPDQGTLVASFTDGEGCTTTQDVTVQVIELPTFGSLTVSQDFLCSGDDLTLTLNDVAVDDGLDVNNLSYDWSFTGITSPATAASSADITIQPTILQTAFQDFTNPTKLGVDLTLEIEGCSAQGSWTAVSDVYPQPKTTVSNVYLCIGQDWEANISGCQVLSVEGQGGMPDLEWLLPDPAAGVDIELSADYMNTPTGGNVNTFDFYAGVTYSDVNLTCFTEGPFALKRRQTPAFTVLGDDTSGPNSDFILCAEEDLTLTINATYGAADKAYSWAILDPASSELVPYNTTNADNEEAYFVDVAPAAPLDAPTLIEGVAYVEYSGYVSTPPDFSCVVEEPWSFQVLPLPAVEWTLPETHVCSGEQAVVQVNLVEGAVSLNGVDVEWDWDWNVSTFSGVEHTLEPFDELDIEALYESNVSGMFEQDMSVVVTDSYGCISAVSEQSFTALELPEVSLVLPLACAGDDMEIVAYGADDYEWSAGVLALGPVVNGLQDALGLAPTGSNSQSIVLPSPANGVNIDVVGTLIYTPNPGEEYTCSTSAPTEVTVVYDLPVLQESITLDPAPYCEGDVVVFEDLDLGGNLPNITYTYTTNTGIDSTSSANSLEFTLQDPMTLLEATKSELHEFSPSESITCSVNFEVDFVVESRPVISLEGNAGICQDGEGSIECVVSDPVAGFTYVPTWTNSSNVEQVNATNGDLILEVVSEPGVEIPASAPLEFSVLVTDDNGCVSDEAAHEMKVLSTPIIEVVDGLLPELCAPQNECMTVSLLNEGLEPDLDVKFFWDNEPGSIDNSHCSTYSNPTECPYEDYMTLTVRYGHMLDGGQMLFCATDTVNAVVVNPSPQPSFTLTEPQACLDLNGNNCVPFVHDTLQYDVCDTDSLAYEWFVTPLGGLIQNDLTVIGLNTPFPSVCLDTAGVVNLVLEITNQYGCAVSTPNVTYTVRGLPVPELTFAQPSICLPTTVSVLNSSAGASTYSMSIPGFPTYENFLSPLELNVEFPGYYNAEFTVSNSHTIGTHTITCSVDTEYVQAFEGREPPHAEFVVLPDTLIEFVNPVVEFVNLSEGETENIWSFGNGEGSSERNPELEYEAAGTYNAQLLVVNEYGCTDVFTQPIEVYTDLYVYVPTAFTPNNDGLNDAWDPSIIGQDVIAKYECWVYNRTGHVLFYTDNPNKAWRGENERTGEGLHYTGGTETFVWRIAIKRKNGEGAQVYEGHVTMIR